MPESAPPVFDQIRSPAAVSLSSAVSVATAVSPSSTRKGPSLVMSGAVMVCAIACVPAVNTNTSTSKNARPPTMAANTRTANALKEVPIKASAGTSGPRGCCPRRRSRPRPSRPPHSSASPRSRGSHPPSSGSARPTVTNRGGTLPAPRRDAELWQRPVAPERSTRKGFFPLTAKG